MKKYLRPIGIVVLLGIVIGCGLFASDWRYANTPNTTRNLAVRFGASEGEIARVASAYGVAMGNISEYGEAPFPFGVIALRFGFNRAETERVIVRRQDVEGYVKGHLAECKTDRNQTLYLFYSQRFAPKPWRTGESAFVVRLIYKATPQTVNQDPAEDILTYMTYEDLNSDSGWLGSQRDREAVAQTCVPPVTTR
jgi:hypothetical protein